MNVYSLVVPIYKSALGLPPLFVELTKMDEALGNRLEVIFVIDGSPDNSGSVILNTSHAFKSRTVFHSRNFGAFMAIRTGMEHASGDFVAAMAADLQEPPGLILEFFKILSSGQADITFGQRMSRQDPPLTKLFSNVFWGAYRRFVLPDMPKGGVDVFAGNRDVVNAVLAIEEPNSSLVTQLFWVGFRRQFVPYERKAREHGKSAWNFSRRFRYLMDSVFSYTDLPIMVLLWVGVIGCAISLTGGVVTLFGRMMGYITEPGYTTLVLLTMFFGSLILSVQGIIGCYVWRALENTKRRPLRFVSRVVDLDRERPL